jgi:hypothetical protein
LEKRDERIAEPALVILLEAAVAALEQRGMIPS